MKLKRFAIAAVLTAALVASAAEFRPVAVTAATETYGARFAADKMIDGDLATYACFQDDSRDGFDAKADPPYAAAPVTCAFVLDLGEEREAGDSRVETVMPHSGNTMRNASIICSRSVSSTGCSGVKPPLTGVMRGKANWMRLS